VKPALEQAFGNLEADKITVGLRSKVSLSDLQTSKPNSTFSALPDSVRM